MFVCFFQSLSLRNGKIWFRETDILACVLEASPFVSCQGGGAAAGSLGVPCEVETCLLPCAEKQRKSGLSRFFQVGSTTILLCILKALLVGFI